MQLGSDITPIDRPGNPKRSAAIETGQWPVTCSFARA
jgi:hypothetical protein